MKNIFYKIYGGNFWITILNGYIQGVIQLFIMYNISIIFNYSTKGETSYILSKIPSFIILIVIFMVFNFSMDLFISLKRQKNNEIFMEFIYRGLLETSYEAIEKKTFGEVITILNKDIRDVIEILDLTLSKVSINLLVFITYFICLSKINLYYSCIMCFLGVLTLTIPFILKNKYDAAIKDYYGAWEALEDSLSTTIKSFEFMKLNNLYKYFEEKYFIVAKAMGKVSIALDKTAHTEQALKIFLESIGNIGGFVVISILLYKNLINFGQVIICVFLGKEIIKLLNNIFSEYNNIQKYHIALERIENLFNSKDSYGKVLLKNIDTLQFEKVSFSYNNDTQVFKDLSFTINKGDKILIEGENGQGKSTMIKLLLNLYEDFQGNVKINNINIRDLDKKSYRKKLRYLSQNQCFLFDNAFENVQLFKDDSEHINFYLKSFDISLDHIKNKSYYELSGGQKQKLCIIRTLLGDFDLLILDEPSNFLDSKAIESLKGILKSLDKTLIIISHDSSFKTVCEKVFSLKNGEIKVEDLLI